MSYSPSSFLYNLNKFYRHLSLHSLHAEQQNVNNLTRHIIFILQSISPQNSPIETNPAYLLDICNSALIKNAEEYQEKAQQTLTSGLDIETKLLRLNFFEHNFLDSKKLLKILLFYTKFIVTLYNIHSDQIQSQEQLFRLRSYILTFIHNFFVIIDSCFAITHEYLEINLQQIPLLNLSPYRNFIIDKIEAAIDLLKHCRELAQLLRWTLFSNDFTEKIDLLNKIHQELTDAPLPRLSR